MGRRFCTPSMALKTGEAARRGHGYAWRACCTFATLESSIALSICFFAEKVALRSVYVFDTKAAVTGLLPAAGECKEKDRSKGVSFARSSMSDL